MPGSLAQPRTPEPGRHRIGPGEPRLVHHPLAARARDGILRGRAMMLAAVIVPVGRRSTDQESLCLIARQFGYGTLVALGVLIATGTGWPSIFTCGAPSPMVTPKRSAFRLH